MPYALKVIVDTAENAPTPASAIPTIIHALMFYVGIWVAMLMLMRWQEWLQFDIMPQTQAQIRLQTMQYVMQHSHKYFSEHFAGSIANKVNDLARAANDLFFWVNWTFTSAVATIIATAIVIATIDPMLAGIICIWFCLTLTGEIFVARRVSHAAEVNAEDKSMLTGKFVDVLTNMFNVRSFARRSHEQRYLEAAQGVEIKSHRVLRKQALISELAVEIPIVILLSVLSAVLVTSWKNGWINTGSFVYVVFTTTGTMWVTWRLGSSMHQFFDGLGTCRQALSLIHKKHDIVDAPDATPLAVGGGEIVFDNVHFHYITGKDIFRNKSITIRAGEKVGLVGFSGSGKSTFVNLILRFYEVESGRILIDGQDIARVTQDSLHEAIAIIPQDTSLFHRTLMENIRYGQPEASDEAVIAASKRAHCDEFVIQTEHGYHSLVGERGVKLSGGQRQRIAIARAILKNAPVLILDEATSSLDSITEKYIQQGLAELMQGRTTIVIAHRLSTLAHMDRILVFKDGEIIEDGGHQALLSANGHYAMLWNMQAGGFLPEEI